MKKVITVLSAVSMAAIFTTASGWDSSGVSSESDSVVTIGEQVWMTKNLDVVEFRNGDPIPHAKTEVEWERATLRGEPAWCYYDNDPANGEKYGKLYNWYAVNDPRGLAPEGWKIPDAKDWDQLMDFLGGEEDAGKKIKDTDFWKDSRGGSGSGTNESGFSAFPGGMCYGDGSFEEAGYAGFWWLFPDHPTQHSRYRIIRNSSDEVHRDAGNKERGMSVRCLLIRKSTT